MTDFKISPPNQPKPIEQDLKQVRSTKRDARKKIVDKHLKRLGYKTK